MERSDERTPLRDEDEGLVARVRARDEAAFKALLGRHYRATIRLASAFVRSEAVAEEVAQEAWIAVLQGIDGFEGRSSFKAWLLRIVANAAKKRAAREARSVPISAVSSIDREGVEMSGEAAVDLDRFASSGRWVGHWTAPPAPWGAEAEERLLSGEVKALILAEIEALPGLSRLVITLRDVDGCSSEEACEVLGITEVNQRVLLHRARSRVRRALEDYLRGEP